MVLERFACIEEKPLQLRDLPVPEPGKEEIRIRVKVCGVCHTDLHTVEGELSEVKLPVVPGHQVVGTIEKQGHGALRFERGDRVGVAWLYSTCGRCKHCLQGKENLCESARFTGYSVHGGYAEYMVIPEKFAYKIPDAFTDEQASPLLCAGIIGYRALRLSEIKPGARLGLYGFGASAHVAIQIAVHWGAEVYVFSRSQAHREHACSLGAVWAGTSKDKPPLKMDSSIIFAPAGPLVLDALSALDRGGTLALAGIYMTPIPEMDYCKYLYQEHTLRSVANATRQDGEELLQIASEIPIKTTTQVIPLQEANEALKWVKHSQVDGAMVLKM